MRPSPLSLAATVTYHRIILISRGKTPRRKLAEFANLPPLSPSAPFPPSSPSSLRLKKGTGYAHSWGCRRGLATPSQPSSARLHPSVSRFQGAADPSSAETRKIRICLAHSCDHRPIQGMLSIMRKLRCFRLRRNRTCGFREVGRSKDG